LREGATEDHRIGSISPIVRINERQRLHEAAHVAVIFPVNVSFFAGRPAFFFAPPASGMPPFRQLDAIRTRTQL